MLFGGTRETPLCILGRVIAAQVTVLVIAEYLHLPCLSSDASVG